MWRTILLSLLILPGAVGAAELVKFGPTLCGDGAHLAGGACVPYDQGKCPAGYYTMRVDGSTFAAQAREMRCMNTYNEMTLPEFFYPIYNGVLVKFGPTLCGDGYQLSKGECKPKVQGRCPDNFYQTPVAQSTFAALSVGTQQCMNTYNMFELPEDILALIYNGVLVNFGPKLCGAGMRAIDGTCVPVERGDCPENFYDVALADDTFVKKTDGVCPGGYTNFYLTQNCADDATEPLCGVLCDAGLRYTDAGTCAALCDRGWTTFNMTGRTPIPLYHTPQTTPAINVGAADAACYINVLPGAVTGTANILYNNKIYHVSD